MWCFISNFPAPMWQKSLMISLQSSNYFLPHSISLLIAVAVTITWTCIFQNTSICFPNEMHAYLYDPQVRATYATVLFKHCFLQQILEVLTLSWIEDDSQSLCCHHTRLLLRCHCFVGSQMTFCSKVFIVRNWGWMSVTLLIFRCAAPGNYTPSSYFSTSIPRTRTRLNKLRSTHPPFLPYQTFLHEWKPNNHHIAFTCSHLPCTLTPQN